MAQALEIEGSHMQGLLHRVTETKMQHLDTFELGYIRKLGRGIPYGAEAPVEATVYCKPSQESSSDNKDDNNFSTLLAEVDKPPTQRYVDLLIAGAKHWGVEADYIQKIQNHPRRPRKPPHEFLSLGDSDVLYEVIPKSDEQYLYCSLNGKILKYSYPPDTMCGKFTRQSQERYGPHVEISMANALYDVKYGAPDRLQDFTQQHSAHIEDQLHDVLEQSGNQHYVEVIGVYTAQTWAD